MAAETTDTALPQWLDDLLKPGVSAGIFTTLKASLVGLVLVLCVLLSMLEDPVSEHCSPLPPTRSRLSQARSRLVPHRLSVCT